MKTGLAWLACTAIALSVANPMHAAEHSGRRVALVIGNSAYDNLQSLSNPANDARRMAEILTKNGFEVMSCGDGPGCFDLDRGELLDAVEDFAALARGAGTAFAYYAGHGMQTGQGNVLAPTDFELDCASGVSKRSVLLDELVEALAGAQDKVLVVDACRNDPLKAQQCPNRGMRILSFGSIAVPASSSRLLLVSSTQNGQVALDGLPGTHSPFAQVLFDWLEKSPNINFDQVFNRVARGVIDATSAQNFTQIPEMLVRGGAPDACLSGQNCGSDPDAGKLRAQVAALQAEKLRNQDFEAMVVALMEGAGLDPRTTSAEDKERFFRTVIAAAKSLEARGGEGELALAALRTGDSGDAEAIFQRDIQAKSGKDGGGQDQRAESARDLAALKRVQGKLNEAVSLYRAATQATPGDLSLWIDLAETAIAAGQPNLAQTAYAEGLKVSASGKPADRVWVLEGYADTFWNSDSKQALALYGQANDLAAQLLKHDPDDAGLKRGLIVTHYNIGHLAMDAGDTQTAIARFKDGLAIAEGLAAAQPADLRWRFDIGRGHERIGRALLAAGDTQGALSEFLKKQAIANALARSGEATYVQDAALAEEFLASLAVGAKDWPTAELRYLASLDRMIPLRDAAPQNPSFQRFTSVTLLALGDAQIEQGKSGAAWQNYASAVAISERLAAANPGNGQWRWDLFRGYQRLASTRPPGAGFHAKALATIEAMKADGVLDPSNEQWIATTRERLAAARAQ